MRHLLHRAAALAVAATFAFAPTAFAQSTVLDAPAAPLQQDVAPISAPNGSVVPNTSTMPKAYAVDYVNALRNLAALTVVVLVLIHVQSAAVRGKRAKHEHKKSYVAGIVLSMLVLLAAQALSFWLYAQESGKEGGVMHKTFPLGRTYFLY